MRRLLRLTFALILPVFVMSCTEEAPTSLIDSSRQAPLRLSDASSMTVLPPGAGLQRFVEGRPQRDCVDVELCTGVLVRLPLFSEDDVVVKTGTWVTLGFGVSQTYDHEPTQEELDLVLPDAIQFLTDLDSRLTFGGVAITSLNDYFRPEAIEVVVLDPPIPQPPPPEDPEVILTHQTIIFWRYYVQPQSPGTYSYEVSLFDGGLVRDRDVIWEEGEEEEEVEEELEVDDD